MVAGKIVAVAIVLTVVVLVAGLGIYYYDAYHKLTFQLEDVRLGSVGLTAVQTDFDIVIGNPGPLPIYIPNGDFDIYLNNQQLGRGAFGSVTVGGNGKNRITVPVTVNTTDIPSALYGVITGGGRVNVTLRGSANLVIFNVPFNATLYDVTF